MVKMSGGEALAKSLVKEGVEVVFGIPGVQMYGIVAGLRDEPEIQMITTRHEQATTYMADGYARASGKPGVALVVPGVGLYKRGVRADECVLTIFARASHSGPGAAGRDGQEPWCGPRSRRPTGHGTVGNQVAKAGAQAPGSAGCRVRGVQADAYRPPPSRLDRDAAGSGRGTGRHQAAQPCPYLSHRA